MWGLRPRAPDPMSRAACRLGSAFRGVGGGAPKQKRTFFIRARQRREPDALHTADPAAPDQRSASRAHFLQKRLQLAIPIHLERDIAAPNQLTLHIKLRVRRPV